MSRPLVLCCLIAIASLARAQFDTGTIAGSVTDSSGGAVPNAELTITNEATSAKVTLRSDARGAFVASALPFGNYTVSASFKGFRTATSSAIVLNVGATVHLNLTLTVAGAEQRVYVTGTPTTVDTTSSTSGTTLNSNQVSNLPINGRDVSDFLEISPGSVASTGFFQGSVNGLENIFTGLNITLDGQNATRGDVNGFLDTEGGEAARITRASVDSIQEINFANNGYSSENGFSLGPQMNIVTKSGTNGFHGTLFEFFRNDALDAKDFFNTGPKTPLRLNQFGGNLGGPIVRNKLFFFVNYEGDRTHLVSLNPLNETLSAYARSQFVPAMKPVLDQLAPLPTGCTSIPAPSSCAVPNTSAGNNPATQGANLVYAPAILPSILREDTGSVRVDYNLSNKDRLMGRYNINDSLTNQTYGLNQGQVAPQALRTQLGKLDETHTFSPTLLNEFSVAINRFYSDTNSNTPTPLVGFGGFFTDLGSLPGPNSFNQITPHTVFEVFDSITKVAGKHTLKFGPEIRANRNNEWLRPQQTYQFASFHDLENDAPFILQKIGFPGFLGLRNSNWDFYLQDDWRVTRTLTLNLGLRYEYNTVWSEGHDRQQNFDFTTQSFLPANQAAYNEPKTDFAPRFGFAWDPFGKGTTAIHGYFGLFYMPMQFGFGLTTNIPDYSTYSVLFPAPYPTPNPPLPPGTQNVSIFPRSPRDPYSTNWLFGIQQQLAHNTVLTVNYTGNKTQHMQAGIDFAAVNLNPSNPSNGLRPLPNFASENLDADSLSSNYNAMQVQLRRNAGRFTLEANYTWSHEIDDLVNVFGGWSNPFNPGLDHASGDWDVRHNFTASLVYSLPELQGSNSFVRTIFGGWQASSIFQVRSGLPTNVQLISGFFGNPMRPDYVSGQSPYVSNAHWPDSSFNLDAFTLEPNYNGVWGDVIGTLGRNSLRGPGFFQWDLSGMKNFKLTERLRLQFRADLFNILNHPNFANPDGGICKSITSSAPFVCTSNPTFGVSSQTIADASGGAIGNGTARQAQLALKLEF